MKLSIVVPIYNVEEYLEECLESIQKLNLEFEAVLIDDGSPDSSGQICDRWAADDVRFKVVHQANGGLSNARNTGIRESTGDFIMFLDSDDMLEIKETERLVSHMTLDCDALVGMYSEYYSESGTLKREDISCVSDNIGAIKASLFMELIPNDGKSFHMIACRYIINRKFLLDNELFFTEGIYHEDEEWTSRLLCNAENMYLSDCYFYIYRQQRLGSITDVVKPKSVMDRVWILESFASRCKIDDYRSRYLLRRMAMLLMGIQIDSHVLSKNEMKYVNGRLDVYFKNCLSFMSGRIGRCIGLSDRILGIANTTRLLNMLHSIKGR